MSASRYFDDDTRVQILDVFEQHGVASGAVFGVAPASDDEAIFVVRATSFPESTLTRELMRLLERKVWVTPDGPSWAGRIHPLG